MILCYIILSSYQLLYEFVFTIIILLYLIYLFIYFLRNILNACDSFLTIDKKSNSNKLLNLTFNINKKLNIHIHFNVYNLLKPIIQT